MCRQGVPTRGVSRVVHEPLPNARPPEWFTSRRGPAVIRAEDVSREAYIDRFRDPAFGADLAAAIAARHRLPAPLVRKVEGSSLVFRTGDGDWLKISPPFFGDSFAAEVAASERVQGRLPLPIPQLRLTGEIEGWRYLVSADVPGVPIRDVLPSLADDDLVRIAGQLGGFMAAFHAVPPAGFERSFGPWPRYLARCLDDAEELHRNRGNDEALVARVAAFLAPRRAALEALGPPVLIHADLTEEHVLLTETGDRWRVSGVAGPDRADAEPVPRPRRPAAPTRSRRRHCAAGSGRVRHVDGGRAPAPLHARPRLVQARDRRRPHRHR
jgi:hypothetical protein